MNPHTTRASLYDRADTLGPVTIDADRTVLSETGGGKTAILRVAANDSVNAIAYMRFDTFPDTTGLTGATLLLRVQRPQGHNLRIAVYPVVSGGVWVEGDFLWENRPQLAAVGFDTTSVNTVGVADTDTVQVTLGAQIDDRFRNLIKLWASQPDSNRGFGLQVLADEPGGSLQILSREAVITNSPVNPALTYKGGISDGVVRAPTQDTFVYNILPGAAAPPDSILLASDWVSRRAYFHFTIPDSLLPVSGQARGLTVNRAKLLLHVQAASYPTGGSMTIGAYQRIPLATGQDSLGTLFDSDVLPAAFDSTSNTVFLDIGALVQKWIDGTAENDGVLLHIVDEGAGNSFIRYYSSAASPAHRPVLTMVYARPAVPRWGQRKSR